MTRKEEIEKQIAENAEAFKRGDMTYEELHSEQYLLFKELRKIEGE